MNGALLREEQVRQAMGWLIALRISGHRVRHHQTPEKNWDLADFTRTILDNVPKKAAILDVGCDGNPLLENLRELGYRNLSGIDFNADPGSIEGVDIVKADFLHPIFPSDSFDCITSLSVIEHGCPPYRYMREMSRILKPGGLLLTSTDYWPDKVRTWNVPKRRTFGLPWTIMTEPDVRGFVRCGQENGLKLTAPIDYGVQDKVVKWGGKKYTFLSFAMQKVIT